MSKFKLILFITVLAVAAVVIVYDKAIKPQAEKLSPFIDADGYYKIMWFGPTVKAVDAEKLFEEVNAGEESIYLIDLRTEIEYNSGHIDGTLSMPFEEYVKFSVDDFSKVKKTIVFISSDEKLAKFACKQMVLQGFTNVVYLAGGMNNWKFTLAKNTSINNQEIK
jgi:rhodanese-related sulfurtransferase